MRVLVTGGTGVIGEGLIPAARRARHARLKIPRKALRVKALGGRRPA